MTPSRPHRFNDALGHGPSDKRIEILRGVGRTGSISQSARDAGVSYKAAWQAIATLTNLAGVPLVARAVGGAGGGGATLTVEGGQLLSLADAHAAARSAVQGSVAGAAGAVARLSIRTSMRNQLPAVVSALERSGPVVRVRLALGNEESMAARITQESAELLALAEGMAAMALCKATAVRVARADAATPRGRGNRLMGTVAKVARGEGGDEIAIMLAGGLQLVGFAASGSGLRTRQRVIAVVDESAVVVALPG